MKETKFIKLVKTNSGFPKKMTYLEAFKGYGGKMVQNPLLDAYLQENPDYSVNDNEKVWTINMIGGVKSTEKIDAGVDLVDYEAKTLLPGKFISKDHEGENTVLFITPKTIEKTETKKGQFYIVEPKTIIPVSGVVRINIQKVKVANAKMTDAISHLMKNVTGIIDKKTGLALEYFQGIEKGLELPEDDPEDDGMTVKIVGNTHYIVQGNWVRNSYIPNGQILKPIYRKSSSYCGEDDKYYGHGIQNTQILVADNLDGEKAAVAIKEIIN